MEKMHDTRIAVVISNAPLGSTRENLLQIEQWVEKACKAGADLICFPEMTITGYHIQPLIREFAEPADGPAVRQLKAIAENRQKTILAGLAEKEPKSGQIYAAHLVLRPGAPAGRYRKTHLGPPEQAVFSAGDKAPLFSTENLTFGVQLCYDAHFPELSTGMAVQGADAVFIPHASPGGTPEEKLASWMRHLPARAFDNGIFVIACNQAGDNGRGLCFPGTGLVLSPSGNVLASHAGEEEHMMVVDLAAAELAAVRQHRMRYFLPNRRPSLYRSLAYPEPL
jgi:N-carbamoylputrescine amidase